VQVVIPILDRITALDAVGPYEVLSRLPGAEVVFAALEPGPKRTDRESLALIADQALADVPHPSIVVVPGGFGTRSLMHDEQMLDWLREAHETTDWTTSVCTGALLLGAAGILGGLRAATHWLARGELEALGVEVAEERVVEQGKVITAAGVSSGIDMALRLAELVAGREVAESIQLSIEYDPQPPFDAGSPATAPPAVVDRLRAAGAAKS
jgi:putative intracellular protease/amidase